MAHNTYACVQQIHCHTIYRAWQRKLHSTVSNNKNLAEIYACLWLLISEKDDNKFLKNENSFISYWNDMEEQFVKYYKEKYKDRAGMYVCAKNHTKLYTMF